MDLTRGFFMLSIELALNLLLVPVVIWFRLKMEKNVVDWETYKWRFAMALAIVQVILLGVLIVTAESVRSLIFELVYFLGMGALTYAMLFENNKYWKTK